MSFSHMRLRKVVLWVLLIGAALGTAGPVFAQNDQPEASSPEITPTPLPTAIPASQIPTRIGEVAAVLRGLEIATQPGGRIAGIASSLPAVIEDIDLLDEGVGPLLEGDGPAEALRDAEAERARIEKKIVGWLGTLGGRAGELDNTVKDLKRSRELWELTRRESADEALPDTLVQQVGETLAAISNLEREIIARRTTLLNLQADVAEQQSRLRMMSEQITREIGLRQQHLLRLDSPPLWKAFGDPVKSDLGRQMLEAFSRNREVLRRFVREHARQLILDVVFFSFLFALFVRLGQQAQLWVQTDASLRTTAALLQHPLASSLLVSIILFGNVLHSTAPIAAKNLSGVVILLIMLRLLPNLVARELRPAIGMLVLLIALYLVIDLIPGTFLLDRIAGLFLAVFGAASCAWTVRQERRYGDSDRDVWSWGALWLASIAAVCFAISAVANVVGAVGFSALLASATLAMIYDAITVWIFVVVLMGAGTVFLRTTFARRLGIVRNHGATIRSVLFRWIRIIAVFGWFAYALNHFGLLDPATSAIKRILFAKYTLGEFSVSLSNIVVFAVAIWLSIKIAQFTSFVLDEDVLPRLDLPKGVPATISKTSTYVIVTLGVVIAVAAAGLDLSRATILVGALGVGIGFGLQNAVNNFVSGLILLFGRPINVGDKIQIDTVSGVVTDIGIRATVVRTWQGAEVIVPNATLISDNLVNWTLSDDRRRMEIPIGVAYGTSTDQVIELLTEVARAHDDVLDDPEPKTIFTGFGDSALEFELRAWTRGDFVGISSDLRVGIDRTLAEHGIVIPFPQRDLHLRSVGKQAAARLGGDIEEPSMGIAGDQVAESAADGEADDKSH